MANRRSDKDPDCWESVTIASNISTVTGSFLTIGFARDRCSLSIVAFTKGLAEIEVNPTQECTHDIVFAASSTAALDLDVSLTCCKYSTN